VLPVLQIGRLALQTSGLILLIGVWVSYTLTERQAPFHQLTADIIYNLTVVLVVAGVLGARLAYVGLHFQIFLQKPVELFSLSPQLLNLSGGLAIAAVVAGIYTRRKGHSLWRILDAFSLAFAILLAFIALSDLASGNSYGLPANLPWAIRMTETPRHPTPIYDLLAALAMIWLLWPKSNSARSAWISKYSGQRFILFLILASAARLFLDGFRADSSAIFGSFRQAQVIAWFLLAYSLWQFGRFHNFFSNPPPEQAPHEPPTP
jgi:phosphatidylglycerol---prolipoprotein diacylglyceryl transferase